MKKRVLSLFLAITLCLTLTPTGALAEESLPEQTVAATQETETPTPAPQKEESQPEQTVAATQETKTPTPAPQKEEPTTPAENGADENASPASPDEKPTENTPAAPEKNPADEEPGKEAGQNKPTAEGENEPLTLGLGDAAQNAADGENSEGSGGTHYVAESGGTKYETVQDILDNMEEEITLLDSVTEDLTVCAATTIYMNGYSITGNIDAMYSLTLNGGTVDGTVTVDATGGTFTMTAPAEAEAAITGGLNVVSGSAFVSGAQVGVKGTLYFNGTDMLISGAVKAVELDSAAKPAAKTLYGSATVNGDTAAEAGFDTDTYKVGGEIAKKLTNKQVGSTTPAAPSLTLTETSKSLTAGKTAVFTANYTGTDTLNAYVQGSAVNGYFTISQKNNGGGTYTVSVKIDEETPGGTYTLFVHELGNTSVQASATITVTGLPDAAEVNGKQYKSLPRALAAAQDGDTVKLLADHTTNWSDVEAGEYATLAVVRKTLTLDLNLCTVDYLVVGDVVPDEEGGILESYDGNLTVVENVQGGSYGKIKNLEFLKGSLAIQGGRIGDFDGSKLTCKENSGTVTISGGMVCNATVGDGATVNVTGGTMHQGEWVNNGTLNIKGGTFGGVNFHNNSGTIAISGGTFSTLKNYDNTSPFPIAPISLLAPGHAFYKDNTVQDGSRRDFLQDVTVKEHTHTMVNNKCACGFSCTHTNTEGASTIDKDGKCTVCGTQFAAGIGETYYTDVQSALDAATDGQTVKLLANTMLPSDTYVSKTLTLDLDGHSLSGYSLNVGGLTATSQVRTGNLTVIDSSGGNGAVGVTVRDGGTLVFDPKNDHTTLLQLEVWGGTVELYGGKISRSGLQLNNGITLGDLLPGQAGLAYYRDDTQLTQEEAASQTCDLVVKSCSHGGKNGFDKSATTCPYCGAPAVAETTLYNDDGSRLQRRFADLQTALDADRDGGATLKLLADVTGDYTIDGTQDTGLNLNGHSIKGTVTVKAAAGNNTTTLSNTENTTTVSIDKVVAHKGAKLAGSKFPAVIGELTLAEGATWDTILNDTALGYKVLKADGTHKWYAPKDVKGSQLNNVIINRLPITTKTLNLKVDGKNLTGNSPKVERGTTVQLCASCNAKGADVYIYTGEIVGNNMPAYSRKKAEYQKIGSSWYYVVDLPCNTIGKYSVYFTATKDGYTVQSAEKKLTVTKPNLSNAEITFPYGNEAAFNSVSATGVPMFDVIYKGRTLEKDVDYTIASGGSTYDVGPCTLTIKATDNGDYTGSKSAEWTVRPLKVAASVGDIIKTYDGTTDLPANAKITFKSADSYYTGTTLRLAKGTDYEVSNAHYDSADASETEKTVSFTIKLKNKGYVFDDGTTQKDFTLNGADFDDKTFQINKATALMNNPIGTLNIINGTCQTYTYDFNNILPGLPGGKYGTISYGQADISLVSQSGYYYDETIVEFKKGKLILAQFYAKDGKMTGKIGTVKVNVTTTNYADFQLKLVLNAVDQIKPVPDGTITASEITYGDTLSKSEISGKMKDPNTGDAVNGTFTWTDGTIKPDANDRYEADWTFTPAAGYEKYATVTGTVTIKVNKATPTFTAPTAQENLTYTGQEQPLIIAGSVTSGGTMQYMTENGTYSQDIPTGTDAGEYTVWYRVIGDANHNDTTPASVAVRIGQKPLTITRVTAASKTYDGTTNADITSVTFDGVNLNRGTDYTVTANFDDAGVGKSKNITATVTLTEQTAKNYALEQSSFPTTGSITAKEVNVTITPNGGTYGSVTAAAAELPGAVEGDNVPVTLTYTGNGYNDTAVPVNAGSYTVTASIANSNYTLTGNTTADFVITLKAVTVSGITANDKVYDGTTNAVLDYSNAQFDGILENDKLTVAAKGMFEKAEAGKQNVAISDLKLGGDSAANYVLAGSGNQAQTSATITAKEVTVTPDNKSKVYEENDPKLTYKVSGVLDGETLKGITLARAEGENAGKYAITGTADASANPNYDVTFAKGTFTIEPKSIKSATVMLGKGLAANGAEHTQTVEKVLLGDKEIPADSYTVTGNTATAHGIYTLTITAKGNYTDSIAWTYVIAPSKAEDAPGEDITIGSGKVKVDVQSEGTVPPATLLTDKAELLAMLVNSGDITADELVQIANGASVDIVLTVKEANVSDEVKTAMAQAAKGYTIGQYLDISLFKYMTVNGSQQACVALHTTKDALTISVVVPDALINTNSAVNRTYCIVRNHEGTIDVLDAAFDAAIKTLTFKTDRFSIYAIAYKDTAVPSSGSNPSSNNSSNDSEIKKNEVAAPTPAPTPASTSKPSTITAMPQTGDASNPTLYVVLLVASLLGLAVVFVCKKRNDK